ncbi:SpoIID/LytB domain-containing protein [Zhihengliuella sp.]|uniref:SpoIID/LytB domain-containing protein n=1 Tax=Zhihengliuella sp. TaxID=1954483 RepID=UPI00281106DB|nr:SpoIID/LytB domain-containing protein [Zhihengliuella sp.]
MSDRTSRSGLRAPRLVAAVAALLLAVGLGLAPGVVVPAEAAAPAPAALPAGHTALNPTRQAMTIKDTYLRSSPNWDSSANIVVAVPANSWVTVLQTTRTWWQVKYGAYTGWIHGTVLKAGSYRPSTTTPPPPAVPSSFTFAGSGWGHGVGMSQYGARGQAAEGRTAAQILNYYYAPAVTTGTTSYASSNIRVQLLHAGSTTITPTNGRMRIYANGSYSTTRSAVTMKVSGSNVVLSGGVVTTAPAVTVRWENTRFWTDGTANTVVSVSGADGGTSAGVYRHGQITVKPLNAKLNVVNELRLNDEYLYGLAEMPSSWHREALKAQAIAGRTFAMRAMSALKADCACNVYDEVRSQKFTGWKKEGEATYGARWKDAVNRTLSRNSSGTPTSGTVVKYGSSLIEALYFSSSGGATRNSESVFSGGAVPYLRSHKDPWSLSTAAANPNRAWTQPVSQAKIASAFGLKDVAKVAYTKSSVDLAVVTITATSSSGAKASMTGTQMRSKLGLKSAWLTSVTPK